MAEVSSDQPTSASSKTALETLAEVEKKLAELQKTKVKALEKLGAWTGPVIQLCIMADQTKVVTSTECVGKSEFSASLFRERMEEDLRTEDELSDDIVVELWFDRNGFSLPIILSCMRGYECSSLVSSLSKYERDQLIADCKYYRLPSVMKRLFPKKMAVRRQESSRESTTMKSSSSSSSSTSSSSSSSSKKKSSVPETAAAAVAAAKGDDEKSEALVLHAKPIRRQSSRIGDTAIRGFDKRLMDPLSFLIDSDNNILRKNGGSGRWQCVGVTGSFITGEHSIRFKIKKGGFMDMMFGILERKYFTTEGYFGNPIRGLGFHTYSGDLYTAGNNHIPFGKKPSLGDVIGLTVKINADDKAKSKIKFMNGDTEIGTAPLEGSVSLDNPLIFAVVLYHKGDEVQILP